MLVKCIKCNRRRDISGTRGTKISDFICVCGGSYKAARHTVLFGTNPVYPDSTAIYGRGDKKNEPVFNAYRVGKEYFIFSKDDFVFIPIGHAWLETKGMKSYAN